jgi:hypothetical protein
MLVYEGARLRARISQRSSTSHLDSLNRPSCQTMTFVHRFNGHLTCTMTTSDDPPVSGETFVQNVEWTSQPKPKHLREYTHWCHTVFSRLANHWNLRLMHALQTAPRHWEFWAYTPGEPPKRLQS